MDTKVVVEIFNVITDVMNKGRPFTCYDITRLVRSNGFDVKHSETKDLIHGMFDSGVKFPATYTRHSMVDLKGRPGVAAEVYAPTGFNPRDYNPDALAPISMGAGITSAPTITGSSATIKTTPATKTRPIYTTVRRDCYGRLRIPVKLMRAIGRPNKVYVAPRANNQPGFVVLKNPPKSGQSRHLWVAKDDSVRLSNDILNMCRVGASAANKAFTLRTTDSLDGIVGVAK